MKISENKLNDETKRMIYAETISKRILEMFFIINPDLINASESEITEKLNEFIKKLIAKDEETGKLIWSDPGLSLYFGYNDIVLESKDNKTNES